MKESSGWKLTWTSPYIDQRVDHIALNANKSAINTPPAIDTAQRMIAASHGTLIQLWSVSDNGDSVKDIGTDPSMINNNMRMVVVVYPLP